MFTAEPTEAVVNTYGTLFTMNNLFESLKKFLPEHVLTSS